MRAARAGVVAVVILCGIAGAAATPAAAQTLSEAATQGRPGLAANQGAFLDWAARNAAYVGDEVPCGNVCDDLWLSEHRPMPNQARSSDLWDELDRLNEKAGGRPPRYAGLLKAAGGAFAVMGTAKLGWDIGTGLRKMWVGVESVAVQGDPLPTNRVDFRKRGEAIFSNGSTTVEMPATGAVALDPNNGPFLREAMLPPCFSSPGRDDFQVQLPAGWADVGKAFACPFGGPGSHTQAAVVHTTPVKTLGPELPPGWTQGDRPNWSPTKTGTEVRTGVATEVNSDPAAYATVLDWADAKMGGTSADPTEQEAPPAEGGGAGAPPGSEPPPADSDCGAPPIRSVDLGPLSVGLGSSFPFGVLPWMLGVFGDFVSTPGQAPSWTIDVLGHDLNVDLALADSALAILRPLFLTLAIFGFLWFLASFALGKGRDGGAAGE